MKVNLKYEDLKHIYDIKTPCIFSQEKTLIKDLRPALPYNLGAYQIFKSNKH